jgi:hypothetical protein
MVNITIIYKITQAEIINESYVNAKLYCLGCERKSELLKLGVGVIRARCVGAIQIRECSVQMKIGI